MFGELEDADESNDAEKGERRARFGSGAAHRRQNIEERHVVRHDRHHVHDVLEVSPEPELRRTRNETHDRLDGKPGRADRLPEEERIEEVRQLSLFTVRHGVGRQRLDAEQNDGQQSHQHRPDGHQERDPRRLRELEDHPDTAQRRVGRPRNFLRRVAFRAPVLVDGVRFQLVKVEFFEEDVIWNWIGATQTAATLVVDEDGLEAGPVSVEEELTPLAVVELGATKTISEQRVWMTFEYPERRLEVVAADVDTNPLLTISTTYVKRCDLPE